MKIERIDTAKSFQTAFRITENREAQEINNIESNLFIVTKVQKNYYLLECYKIRVLCVQT